MAHTVHGRILHHLIGSFTPLFTKVLYIPGGCMGFLPSTVAAWLKHGLFFYTFFWVSNILENRRGHFEYHENR